MTSPDSSPATTPPRTACRSRTAPRGHLLLLDDVVKTGHVFLRQNAAVEPDRGARGVVPEDELAADDHLRLHGQDGLLQRQSPDRVLLLIAAVLGPDAHHLLAVGAGRVLE
jgi:hypothetical protein